jgi:hypothetical protein
MMGITMVSEVIFLLCVAVFVTVGLFSISSIMKKNTRIIIQPVYTPPPSTVELNTTPQNRGLTIEDMEDVCIEVAQKRLMEETEELYGKL